MKILNKYCLAVLVAAFCLQNAAAQGDKTWREKVRAERIAFLTAEMSLTPEEAQVFWPVYNQAAQEKHAANKKVMDCYKELSEAVEKKASDAELNRLLEAYSAAVAASRSTHGEYLKRYRSILSVEKIARLYVAEEKFRRQQVCRMPRPGGSPEGPRQP